MMGNVGPAEMLFLTVIMVGLPLVAVGVVIYFARRILKAVDRNKDSVARSEFERLQAEVEAMKANMHSRN